MNLSSIHPKNSVNFTDIIGISMNKNKPPLALTEMFYCLKRSSSMYRPSDFWQKLNLMHLSQLNKNGIGNFKRSIGTKYFDWGILGILYHQLSPLLSCLKKGNINPLIHSEFENYALEMKSARNFNWFAAVIYRTHVAALAEYIKKQDHQNLLKKIEEPKLGNPFIIKYKNRLISQDLCNSIDEYYSISSHVSLPKNIRIAELGAGYGRLGYVFQRALPKSSYTVIDIPPALYIAQKYLPKVIFTRKVFYFRPFTTYESVHHEFEKAKIKFLLASQMEKLPKNYFDLIINISSLHEMTREQIRNYIHLIDKTCRGYFYTKQWRRSKTADNNYISEAEYPIPKHWKTIYHRRHPIQSMFFEALYQVKPSK